MDIIIRNTSEVPIYDQIKSQIKDWIFNGEIKEGDMLPSLRNLARDLRVSVITTKRAYEELETEGFIAAVPGKGYYVTGQSNAFIMEEYRRRTEEHLGVAAALAKAGGISRAELEQMLELMWEEE